MIETRQAAQARRIGRAGREIGSVMRNKLVLFFAAAAWPAAAMAQTATLRITVVDPSSAVIVGARVEVTPAAPGGARPAAVGSDARGEATFVLLEPGRYTIHVESPGFEPYEARDVRLRAGDTKRTV